MHFLQEFCKIMRNHCKIFVKRCLSCKIISGNTFLARFFQGILFLQDTHKNLARCLLFERILLEYAKIMHSLTRSCKNRARFCKNLERNVIFFVNLEWYSKQWFCKQVHFVVTEIADTLYTFRTKRYNGSIPCQ